MYQWQQVHSKVRDFSLPFSSKYQKTDVYDTIYVVRSIRTRPQLFKRFMCLIFVLMKLTSNIGNYNKPNFWTSSSFFYISTNLFKTLFPTFDQGHKGIVEKDYIRDDNLFQRNHKVWNRHCKLFHANAFWDGWTTKRRSARDRACCHFIANIWKWVIEKRSSLLNSKFNIPTQTKSMQRRKMIDFTSLHTLKLVPLKLKIQFQMKIPSSRVLFERITYIHHRTTLISVKSTPLPIWTVTFGSSPQRTFKQCNV